MTKLLYPLLSLLALSSILSGCSDPSGANAATGEPKADLATIWAACKDHYRKTKAMPPPGEIPDGLAAKYNYESTAGISLNEHSTSVIAYEDKSKDGKRYALFSDGRLEQVSDSELRTVGVEPDHEKHRKQEEEYQRKIDEFNKQFDGRSKKQLP